MIWAILLLLGVPLWLCALGIGALVFRNRALRHRPGNLPVRVLRPGHSRWTRGQGLWVGNVFSWRASPAAWTEDLVLVQTIRLRPDTAPERKPLRHLGDEPTVVELCAADGETLTVAGAAEHHVTLQGPFASEHVA